MSKKILFIADSYSNNPSPNGKCIENIINVLKLQNIFVSVLCYKNQFVKNDTFIDGINVFRVNTHAEWRVLFSNYIPKKIAAFFSKLIKMLKNIFIIFHPLNSPLVILKLYLKGKKIVCNQNINIIVAVYRDFETAFAGVLLKLKYPQIKLCIYTLDSISGGVCSNKLVSNKFHISNCRKWEQIFLRNCDIFCTMKSHNFFYESQMAKKYKEKIKILDIPNLIDINTKGEKLNNLNTEMRFIFTGMMTETNADCTFFLKVFENIIKLQDARFDIYGGISENLMKKLKQTGMYENNIFYHGKIAPSEVKDKLFSSDILLNFGNMYSCGIPCKIFEYMCTGKIIISFYKIDNDASRPYLMKYRNALLLKEEEKKYEEYALKIVEFYKQNKNFKVTYDEVSKIFFQNKPEAFLEMLDSI